MGQVLSRLALITGVEREAALVRDRAWDTVSVAVTGVRSGRAAELAAHMIDQGMEGLVSFGTCGALSPDLTPGDLMVPRAVIAPGGEVYQAEQSWHSRLLDVLGDGPRTAPIAGSDKMMATPAQKAALHLLTDANAVDMESHEIARVAALRKVPFIILRAVSDTSQTAIPTWIGKTIAHDGTLKAGALALGLLTHPWDVPGLIRLGRESDQAFQALRGALGVLGAGFGR